LPAVPNLSAWFSADALSLTNNAAVATWNSTAPSPSLSLTQSTTTPTTNPPRPLFITNALNGKPVVRFDGSNDYLTGGNILNIGNVGQTIFVVAKNNNAGNANRTLFAKSASGTSVSPNANRYALRTTTNSTMQFSFVDKNSNTFTSVSSPSLPDYSIYTTSVDTRNGSIAFFANSAPVQTNFIAPNQNISSTYSFLVGAFNDANGTGAAGSTYFNGDIAEIIVYGRAVTQAERQEVENYMRQKYFPGTERLPISLGGDVIQPYSLQALTIAVEDRNYFTSFAWNTGETTREITATRSGKYSVTVTDDWGWTYADSLTFLKPEINQLRDTVLCAGETLTWDCGISGNYLYTWSTGESTQSIEISTAGTYWVQVTDTDGNTALAEPITVTIDNFPLEVSLGSETALCRGNYLELSGNGTSDIVSYTWNTGATTPKLQVSSSGTYWVRVVNANGCTAQPSLTITVQANGSAPIADFTIDNPCQNQIATLRQTASTSDGSHIIRGTWIIENQTLDGLAAEYSFGTLGSHSIQLTVSTNEGCSARVQKTISINSVPSVGIAPLITCEGVPTTFAPIAPSSDIVRYEWTLEGASTIYQTLQHIFAAAGEIPLQLRVVSSNGCASVTQNTVSVRSAPQLNITFSTNCEQHPVYFFDRSAYATINDAVSRTWYVNGAAVSTEALFSTTMTAAATVRYEVQTMNGCRLAWEKSIPLNPLPKAITTNIVSCEHTPIALSETSTGNGDNISTWQWRVNNTWYNSQNPTVSFAAAGVYNVMLLVSTEHNCSDSTHATITIDKTPQAAFSFTPEEGIAGEAILFTNFSNNAANYVWQFGESDTKETAETTPFDYTFTSAGTFPVQLNAYSEHGCADSVQHTILLQETHHELSIVDCTLLETALGTVAQVHVVNVSNVALRTINFVFRQNNLAPFTETWTGTLAPGETLVYNQQFITPGDASKFSYIIIDASALENPQGAALFSTHFSKDFAEHFVVHTFGPIPAHERINLIFASTGTAPVTITIYNMQGKTSFSAHITPSAGLNVHTLDVASLAPGRYECHITQNGNTIRKPILIE
jgi:hypothetical protein